MNKKILFWVAIAVIVALAFLVDFRRIANPIPTDDEIDSVNESLNSSGTEAEIEASVDESVESDIPELIE